MCQNLSQATPEGKFGRMTARPDVDTAHAGSQPPGPPAAGLIQPYGADGSETAATGLVLGIVAVMFFTAVLLVVLSLFGPAVYSVAPAI